MRPVSNSTTTAGFWHWSSPMPYLFGGLALMLGVIAVALIILACSYRKSLSDESRGDGHEEKPGAKQAELTVDSDEPKIVVIMAGDDNPTFLAKPKPKPRLEPAVVVCNCQKIEQV
ncbi:protein GLUTAMINE DUMPER 4 [Ricinus communis]|uniref:Uncharacterized protein n=1 Tax=Ricinus communis TaxID=3988 RepID=B9SXU5_RICCO|nr:protein GLUTAMINE DUMPER 4 [Ricinus communis]EEF31582.1 conserved hypothetical protein [Ricinus communis]|eukprot:XP_002530814.1 protein GLUTAMINE DUMPER 4 [Ricinus communis]